MAAAKQRCVCLFAGPLRQYTAKDHRSDAGVGNASELTFIHVC